MMLHFFLKLRSFAVTVPLGVLATNRRGVRLSSSLTHMVISPWRLKKRPGPKSFDFDVNQISYSAQRAKVATFSSSYYDVRQGVVVRKGTPIASVRGVAGLRKYKLGAQIGTTSYRYIVDHIKPDRQPSAFPQNIGAINALKNGQIDGLVVDVPTGFIVTAVQVPNSKVLGQLPRVSGGEHFGALFQKGNPLVGCRRKSCNSRKSISSSTRARCATSSRRARPQ